MAFTAEETRILLHTPRVGPLVIRRLEAVGLDSVAQLQTVGLEEAVNRVCTLVGSVAWRNRQRALASALTQLLAGSALQRESHASAPSWPRALGQGHAAQSMV